jgi:hypothetical protein
LTYYSIYYCRDNGTVGTIDDLPAILSSNTITRGTSAENHVLKESYFFRERSPLGSTLLQVNDDQTGGSITASWGGVPGAAGYKLYWGTSPGTYSEYLDVYNVNSHIIDGLMNNQTYYFNLTSYSANRAESSFYGETSMVPTDQEPPIAPQNLRSEIGTGQVKLLWDENTDAATFKVYYGTSPGVFGSAKSVRKNEVIITGLQSGKTYYFAVSALDRAEPSNESARTEIDVVPN